MRLKLLVAYDGTSYEGWQIQLNPRQPRTIQGVLEAAFYTLTGCQCRVTGAGRTDAGTHAYGQAAHVDVPSRPWDWQERLNMMLPPDIRIVSASAVAPDFHARKDAVAKTYVYRFWQEKSYVPPHLRNFVWACGPLDIERMRAACGPLLGEHDFASFQNSGTPQNSTVRTILDLGIVPENPSEYLPPALPILKLEIKANGFLKQMVRNIAGFLAEAGRGKQNAENLAAILEAADRRRLPTPTAPAKGLFLARVSY